MASLDKTLQNCETEAGIRQTAPASISEGSRLHLPTTLLGAGHAFKATLAEVRAAFSGQRSLTAPANAPLTNKILNSVVGTSSTHLNKDLAGFIVQSFLLLFFPPRTVCVAMPCNLQPAMLRLALWMADSHAHPSCRSLYEQNTSLRLPAHLLLTIRIPPDALPLQFSNRTVC